MFKALYESYLSPFYWIFRMFGHDFKDKYRDDIEADLFRICVVPRTGIENKKVLEALKAVFSKIIGHDLDDVNQALKNYYELKRGEEEGDFNDHIRFHDFIVETFSEEVTEQQRAEILDYLSKKKYLRVVKDEYAELERDAQLNARWERRVRKEKRFLEEARARLDDGDDDEEFHEVA
mgnify:FL=1|tara:strand:- start:1052 stop:1585 length:534 start_codon:yes stop_codon:yes gene_type:complete